ncbi:LacI family DNA-binding transcriptional regulator [Lichenicoccus roseus]|uniref:LacI family DNA-binding transcriptional regulator n=1 Tax=Lichenicoccus roseus TaxID=2683649 RepID=A0A5R9JAQ2_9PROT|nr:LacI family DNA-binding transcriptional regulator [Lichenicoccus roseus]
MRDVSRLAGVSRMTVARVLHRSGGVLPTTQARVEQAVSALGYVPDRAAGSLSTRRSGFVGLVLPTLNNANFASLAEGLTEALRPANYEVLIGYTGYSVAEEERQIRTMLARRPEALVLAATGHSPATRRLLEPGRPPVIEIAELPDQPLAHAIGLSNEAAGRAAADTLLGLGHRKLGAIGPGRDGDRIDTRGEARLRGFVAAVAAAGLPTSLALAEGGLPNSYRHGAEAMAALLAQAPDVEAVFAISDLSAVGALSECQRRGIAVPGRISLLGFGDFDIGQQLVPPLSTIATDFPGMGRAAGRMIIELVAPPSTGAGGLQQPALDRRLDIGFNLLERGTTRAAGPAGINHRKASHA